ncbi:MAG TPA: tRNA 2-thiouridine(34) synthase MnmA, partial [Candidatus Eremiobacteraceae bacterium]|nr:tRNA 2-thiouridine(34) synthase MnmA [Candidatus Eremiobacteraceae bacterium]
MQSVIADNPPARSVPLVSTAVGTCLAAMSGGVDSAVATALAVRAGVDAVGVTMRLWSPGPGPLNEKVRQCCGPTAYADAKSAAEVAGIPHYIVNFEAAFSRAVVDYFCREYLAGRTPNPCVACNNLVKFGALLDFARALGAVTLVTGHYARVFVDDNGPHLLRAVDRSKDQSYMLAGLRPDQLASIIMPLGKYTKEQTRTAARELDLDVAEKPDSVDLCFVGGDYRSFIAQRYPESAAAGAMITIDGHEVGRHNGLLGYTIGQRKGLPDTLRDGPWYVLRTDRDTNAVVIGRRDDLARRRVSCSAANIIRSERFAGGQAPGLAVCRYRSRGVPA